MCVELSSYGSLYMYIRNPVISYNCICCFLPPPSPFVSTPYPFSSDGTMLNVWFTKEMNFECGAFCVTCRGEIKLGDFGLARLYEADER